MQEYSAKNRIHRRKVYAEWRNKNKKRRNEYNRQWYESDPKRKVQKAESFKRWRNANREHLKKAQKDYARKNKERIRRYMQDYSKRYYKKNRLRILSQTKAYSKAHPEIRRKCGKNWIRNNPEKARAHNAAGSSVRRARERGAHVPKSGVNKLVKRWKLKKRFTCYFCGNRFPTDRLHIDHFVAVSRGGKHSSDNVCKSCDTCNLRKRAKSVSEITFLNQKLLPI